MTKLRLRRPRYADVVATLALVLAMSGTAYAVTSLPNNSVGTAQLKTGAVTNPKIANGSVGNAKLGTAAVTGSKIADHTVSLRKIVGVQVTASSGDEFDFPAGECLNVDLTIHGAHTGQVALIAPTANIPLTIMFTPALVGDGGDTEVHACNVSGSETIVDQPAFRVVTLG